MTVAEAVWLVLADIQREQAMSSQHTYLWHAKTMIEKWGADTLLQDITRLQVQEWTNGMRSKFKAATIRHKVSFLNRLYKKAREHDIDVSSPTPDVRMPKVNNRRRNYGTANHIELLRPHLKPWRLSIVELAYHTGLRRAEIFRLTPDDIELFKKEVLDENGETIEVVLGYATINESKTGESRVVCLNAEAAHIVRCWVAGSWRALLTIPDG